MDDLWLKQQFKANPDKSKADLALFLGINASGVSKMLNGTRQIKAKEFLVMRKFFGMPVSGTEIEKRKSGIQSYANLRAEDAASQKWAGPEQQKHQIFEVPDSEMTPDFLPGERVLVDISDRNIERSGIFALEENGRKLIRILEKSGTKIKISSLAKDATKKTVSDKSIVVIGRVVAKLNWI